MATVYGSTIVKADPAKVWALVRDFNALPQWFPFILSSELRQGDAPDKVGAVRPCRHAAVELCGNGFWS